MCRSASAYLAWETTFSGGWKNGHYLVYRHKSECPADCFPGVQRCSWRRMWPFRMEVNPFDGIRSRKRPQRIPPISDFPVLARHPQHQQRIRFGNRGGRCGRSRPRRCGQVVFVLRHYRVQPMHRTPTQQNVNSSARLPIDQDQVDCREG